MKTRATENIHKWSGKRGKKYWKSQGILSPEKSRNPGHMLISQ